MSLIHSFQGDLERNNVVHMNYADLLETCPLRDFADALRDEPEDLLACLGLSMCLVRISRHPALTEPQRVLVRLQGVGPLTQMRTLKANAIGAYALHVVLGGLLYKQPRVAWVWRRRDRQAGDGERECCASRRCAAAGQAHGLRVPALWRNSDVPLCGREVRAT